MNALRLLFLWGIVTVFCSNSQADIPKQINFQGVLKDTLGNILPDGNYSLTFRIYDAASGGNILWQEADVFAISGGLVTHLLGSIIPISESVFNDSLRWLGVQVGAQEILPRGQLVSVAYAYVADFAQNAGKLGGVNESNFVRRTGPDSVTAAAGIAFRANVTSNETGQSIGNSNVVRNTGSGQAIGGSFFAGPEGTGFHWGLTAAAQGASTSSTTGMAAWAENTSSGEVVAGRFDAYDLGTGEHYAIKAAGAGSSGATTYGCYASASNSSTGIVHGGRFEALPSGSAGDRHGVYGTATSNSPSPAYGSVGVGVNNSSGQAYGGHFRTSSGGTGIHYGVNGEAYGSSSATTYGSYGLAENTSIGSAFGGYFETAISGTGSHWGVAGLASANSSALLTVGCYGQAVNNSTGVTYGGVFEAPSSGTGTHYGVYGSGSGTSSATTYGSYGFANNASTGIVIGGHFQANTPGTGYHSGVSGVGYGSSSSPVNGSTGYADNSSTGNAFGGNFLATSSGTGTHYGVYGTELAGGSGAAVYASGDFAGSGAKYAVAKTSQGHRLLSVIESPEVWFEDFGEGLLVNGQTHIELDPLFLETVTINASNPMKVFIQLNDPNCNGVAVIKGTTGFEVKELQNGTSNASFDYRILGKRKGYENQRLMQTDVGMDDPNLYPELWEKIEKEHQEQQAEMEKSRIQN